MSKEKKYYVVKNGRMTGIFESWTKCKEQVDHFPGAIFKSFTNAEEAIAYFNGHELDSPAPQNPLKHHIGRHVDIYVDGSYNAETGYYGYGVYVEDRVQPKILLGEGLCVGGGRNIEGEIKAATVALEYATSCGRYDSATIYYDLEHIGAVADKRWKAGTPYTQAYGQYVDQVRASGFVVDFIHVKGHTGNRGNEYVDKLARIGCVVELKNNEWRSLEPLSLVDGFPSRKAPGEYSPTISEIHDADWYLE